MGEQDEQNYRLKRSAAPLGSEVCPFKDELVDEILAREASPSDRLLAEDGTVFLKRRRDGGEG